MKGLFILAIIVAIVWSIVNAAKKRQSANEAWARVAREHGLQLSPSTAFAEPSLRGELHGYRVSIDTHTRGSGKSSTTYTRYRVSYPKLGAKLRLTPEIPVVSAVGKMFGGEDHEIGDAQFDDKVIVRAPSVGQAKAFLTPTRRRAIERFLSAHKYTVITENSATFETVGLESRAESLERGLLRLVELASELASEQPGHAARQRLPPSVRAGAAGVASALAAVAAASSAREDDDWTLPEPPASTAPDAPGGEPVDVPLPQAVETSPPAAVAEERIQIGSAPPMPDVPRIAPDAPAEREEDSPRTARAQDVCERLFAADGGLSRSREVFASDYDGMFVTWSGELRSARHSYSDMVFGSTPSTRAEVEIARVKSGILGEREVVAVLQLPEGEDRALASRVGEQVTFEGDLAAADPFMRHVFVRGARIVG